MNINNKQPYSRIFIVCNKNLRENDLRERFECFGHIEDLYMPKDRFTGEFKGLAFITYSKTSSAAAAIKEMHMKTFNNESKPMKVMVGVDKNESTAQSDNEERYKRLFIKVPKDITETEIRHHFSNFGHVESVYLQRNKLTDESKGFAYVHFKSFYDAAKAFEECDKRYKPVFATPRDDLKRSRNSLDKDHTNMNNSYNNQTEFHNPQNDKYSKPNRHAPDCNVITVKCSPQLPQKYIEQLFNIIPGMEKIHYAVDTFNGISKAVITYNQAANAAHAIEKLHNFEFPSGEILSVKPEYNPLSKAANDLTSIVNNFKYAVDAGTPDLKQLADAIAKASSLITAATTGQIETMESPDKNYCNVSLPSAKPRADINSKVAQRLFIICKPQPPTSLVLHDVFCRFGDLINVSTIPNKTFGFVKYASVTAAQQAIRTLNGAIVTGVRLKVLEADEKPSNEEIDTRNDNEQMDYTVDTKRIRTQ